MDLPKITGFIYMVFFSDPVYCYVFKFIVAYRNGSHGKNPVKTLCMTDGQSGEVLGLSWPY